MLWACPPIEGTIRTRQKSYAKRVACQVEAMEIDAEASENAEAVLL